jgi:quinohemoprotein ethanol dehydrogenase
MAFSAKSNLVYIPVIDLGGTYRDSGRGTEHWQPPTDRTIDNTLDVTLGIVAPKISAGKLLAWNPITQKPVWEVPQPSFITGGVLATAGGLVFQGAMDGTFNAYSDVTGKRLWSFAQDTPIIAPPISYSVNGRQYITVLSGLSTGVNVYGPKLTKFHIDPRTQARRVLAFALGGTATLPSAEQPAPLISHPEFNPDQKSVQEGAVLYGQRCLVCHGASMIAVGHAPDLRRSAIPFSAEAFETVVRGCSLVANGMPCFDELTEQQISDLRQYLRSRPESPAEKQP